MLTFGFVTIVDALSWALMLSLGIKVIATVILLSRDEGSRFDGPWGPALWWATKVTPFVAVPCLIAIASYQHRTADVWIYGALMLFVVVAVPVVVWRRFRAVTP